jgi:hypothetical protein
MARFAFRLILVVFFSSPLFAADIAAEEGWQTYVDNTYKVTLRFPSGWKKDPGYFDRPYFSSERKPHSVVHDFQLLVMGDEGTTPEQACKGEAEHILKPFGEKPTIRSTKVDGQSACLVFPSKDQGAPWYAAAFVKYPKPVQIEGDKWSILALYADKDYFDRIMGSLRFISSAHANPPFSLTIAPGGTGEKSDASWQAGAPFALLLMMENSSQKALHVLLSDPASDRVTAIHRDEPVRVTANLPAVKRPTTALLTTLKPNQSCGDLIEIRFWAENPAAGKYGVQVERDFPAELGKGLAESNTLTVTVIH